MLRWLLDRYWMWRLRRAGWFGDGGDDWAVISAHYDIEQPADGVTVLTPKPVAGPATGEAQR